MKCEKCNQEIAPNARFCSNCGAPVPAGINIDLKQEGDVVEGDVTGVEMDQVPDQANVSVGQKVGTVKKDASLVGVRIGSLTPPGSSPQPVEAPAAPAIPDPFLDVEIHILPLHDDAYPVEITLDGETVFRGSMGAELDDARLNTVPQVAGGYLFEHLFHDPELLKAWAHARGRSERRRVRLNISPGAPELHRLDWEALRDGSTWLPGSAQTPFSRYLPIDQAWGQPSSMQPIRMLVVISNPSNLDEYASPPIQVEAERGALQAGLGAVGEAIRVDFLQGPVTLIRLQDRLSSGYHILHFIGHGKFSSAREEAMLLFQNEQGQTQVVSDLALAAMLNSLAERPALVFLTSCESASRSTSDAFMGLAPLLVANGVPAVIAMQGPLSMISGRQLNEIFYKRLLAHGTVDQALNEARSGLATLQRPDSTLPVLFMRLRSGKLWV